MTAFPITLAHDGATVPGGEHAQCSVLQGALYHMARSHVLAILGKCGHTVLK